jgi:hydrogenase maturation protein HypF
MLIRRARGYAPQPIKAPVRKQILACGAHLKNSFALSRKGEIFLSQHIGDLDNLKTLRSFENNIEHFKKLFAIEPEIIAYDMHPGYLSTKYAREQKGKKVEVQHHHGHICSCMADNGLSNHEVVGVALDGSGYGTDGAMWGGEFLIADYSEFKRVAHLKYVPLPGGEQAIKEPWRMKASYLYDTYGKDFLDVVPGLDRYKGGILEKMIEKRINSPLTSSMGRLFDGVSSLIGLRDRVSYEGQAAIELEMIIEEKNGNRNEEKNGNRNKNKEKYGYEYEITGDRCFIIDHGKIIEGVIDDLHSNVPKKMISLKFHNTVAEMIAEVCEKISEIYGLSEVVLSGGVFQNRFLLSKTFNLLTDRKLRVHVHHQVPTNDGGISLGQTVIADSTG